jgi:ketosteroid isomerase-like protein
MIARFPAAAALTASVLLAASPALSATSDVLAPIHAFADGLSKGDMAAAAGAYAPEATILDEFSPYHWSGAHAFQDWGADFGVFAGKTGTTDPKLTVKAPTRTDVEGDHAYVVAPAVFAFKDHGRAMAEPGIMTFALQKGADGWKLAGWSWAGGKAKPAAAKTAAKKG